MEIISCLESLSDYRRALDIQEQYLRGRIAGTADDTVLFFEHEPVYTIGTLGKISNYIGTDSPPEILRVKRGGDITYHGPGQLVIYPVFGLFHNDLYRYLRFLEEAVINTLSAYGIAGERVTGKTGVFAGGDKIASIGIGVKRWVSYHGVALNVNTDLLYFDKIIPCGLKGVKVTSMEALGKSVPLEEVAAVFGEYLEKSWK